MVLDNQHRRRASWDTTSPSGCSHRELVYTTRANLWVGSHYLFDDMWHDHMVMGWRNSDSQRRYALHKEAGCPASMKDFGNKDFDAFLRFCDGITGETRHRDPEREKMVWRIRKDAADAGFTEAYLSHLSTDLYGLGCWEELSKDDLEKFRNTVHNRAYVANPDEVDFIPGMAARFTKPDFEPETSPVAEMAECPF